jgi:predicted RNase H-like HicB family nuclease
MNNFNLQYTILIQWSDEDQCFIVSLPEWGNFVHTHGNTYEEALHNGKDLLNFLIESALENQEELPNPNKFKTSLSVA